jgi:hypothetical protein
METRKKILIAILSVAIVGAAIAFQMNGSNLFKGQLELQTDLEGENLVGSEVEQIEEEKLPNLKASLVVINPENENEDLVLDATIENLGPGAVTGETPYSYALMINDIEIFRNTDSYTSMEAGDAISFQYPVSRALYDYATTGTATLIIDIENVIQEVEKGNNKVVVEYSF